MNDSTLDSYAHNNENDYPIVRPSTYKPMTSEERGGRYCQNDAVVPKLTLMRKWVVLEKQQQVVGKMFRLYCWYLM